MKRKITIIGAGNVGSTIAYTLAQTRAAAEIVMIDINENKLAGEALDIQQSTSFSSACDVSAGSYEDARDSEVVVITSGLARKPGQSRLDLTRANVEILKSITPKIVANAPNAIYIIVSNPVDILTYVFTKISGIPESRIIGSGTMLDTARLRSRFAKHLRLNDSNIHAYVFGEHGDSSLIPWSVARISAIPLEEYVEKVTGEKLDKQAIEAELRSSAIKIIEGKGATYYAVAAATCHIIKALFESADTSVVVSTVLHGEYGIEDVALSMHTLIGPEGVKGRICIGITEEEKAQLRHSADTLKSIINELDLNV